MAILRPASDIITGGWSSTGASLYTEIDETSASNADYISSSTAGQKCQIALGTTTDPGNDNNHVLRYQAESDGDRGLIARVIETGQPPAIVTSKQPWRQQPQVPVGIDWNNPLTCGLCHGVIRFRDFVKDKALVQNTQLLKTTRLGVGISPPINTAIGATTTSALLTSNGVGTGDFTIFFYGAPPASTTKSIPVNSSDAIGGGVYEPYLLVNANNSLVASSGLLTFTLSGAAGYASISGAIDGTPKLFVGVRRAGVLSVYANNVSAIGGSNAASIARSTMKFTVGAHVASGNFGANEYGVVLAGALNRAWSVEDIARAMANPWQIFRKQSRPIFIDAPKIIATQTKTAGEIGSSYNGTIALTSGEAANITDYANLAVELEST